MAVNTTYLVTGASRGRAYVEIFLRRPYMTVIAIVRGPASEPSLTLASLPAGDRSALHIVKLDNAVLADPAAAVAVISGLGIAKLDVVIANAGVVGSHRRVDSVDVDELNEVMQINTWSHMMLFQALLNKGLLKQGAKFVVAGSSMGSIGGVDQRPFPDASYGASKAALHFLARKIHQEHPELIVFNMDVGQARSDMSEDFCKFNGLGAPAMTAKEVAGRCVEQIDAATRETHGGKYVMYDGSDFPW